MDNIYCCYTARNKKTNKIHCLAMFFDNYKEEYAYYLYITAQVCKKISQESFDENFEILNEFEEKDLEEKINTLEMFI